jgi:crotonobetainyl-CoA:carnitine CoA-transferase CaiB-like acyl-CoA transferase
MAQEAFGPLAGLRVIDLTHVMAGPTCTLMLADMGADVIKVERMGAGEESRGDTEPYNVGGVSSSFMMMNRNKRGVAIDLKSAGGRRVVQRLLAGADVLVENFRKGAMERLGLGYDALHEACPRLIYCAVSGYGRTGPDAGRGGFDLVAQGTSGLMSVTGEGPGRAPVKVGPPLTDITAGILGAMGILAALHARERTGEGQMVDTSLLEAGVVHTYWHSAIAFAGGGTGPLGSAHPLSAPYQAFETADGWIALGAANQPTWLGLLDVLDAPEIAGDARFATNAGRMANLAALEEALGAVFARRTNADWLARLDAAGVPAGPINTIPAMHQDAQVRARGMVTTVEHPIAGPVETIGAPVKFSGTPGSVARPAPLHGEHTREVLAEAGFTTEEIDALAGEGAIGLGDQRPIGSRQ